MLALAGGFGFSFSVIILPFADIGRQAWRIPFGLGALTILLAPVIGRRLAETRRYEALARTDIDRGRVRDIREQGYGRRFLLLAAVAFLLNIFSAPSSQLANKYLTDVHHFSNSGIALFRTVTTGLPGLFGLVLGGRLAEVRGRRPIAAIALTIATATQMVFFLAGGALIWVMAGHVDRRRERGRHRARHAGDRAVPDGDAEHVERPPRRDRSVRVRARLRRDRPARV